MKKCNRRLLVERLEERRVLNSDWQNPLEPLDTSTDGFVSPLDALLVINELNGPGPRELAGRPDALTPLVDVSGELFLSSLDALLIINHLNSTGSGPVSGVMLESASQIHMEQVLAIAPGTGTGTRRLLVDLEKVLAEQNPSLATQDVLSVYIVDKDEPSKTLVDRGTNGSAIFSMRGSTVELVPGISTWNGETLSVDLTALGNRADAALKIQLLNGDGVIRSMVRVGELQFEVDAEGTVEEIDVDPPVAAEPGPPVNVTDYTSGPSVKLNVSQVQYDSLSGSYLAHLALDNQGEAIGRSAIVTLAGLPSGATLVNASGTTTDQLPYINFAPTIVGAGLGQNSQSLDLQLRIANPSHAPRILQPTILIGAPNAAPSLPVISELNVTVGDRLVVELAELDSDGDVLTYTIAGLASDESGAFLSGVSLSEDGLTVAPAPGQTGTFEFELFASDGMLEDSQIVRVNIQSDPIQTTRISGQVLDVDGTPLSGLQVEIGAIQALTQSDGSFLLDLGSGIPPSETIKVRGELLSGQATYPFIAEKLSLLLDREVYQGVNNVITRPIYLPKLDIANGKVIDPTQVTTVTTAAIPDASVTVAAGTLMNQQGTLFTGRLTITEVPTSLTPAALPEGLVPDLVVTIQPGEMVFATPAPLSLPNRSGLAPDIKLDLWSINPVTGEFEVVGVGQVSSNGQSIQTISGGIRNSSWHFFAILASFFEFPELPHNQDETCQSQELSCPTTSTAVMHSGVMMESHTTPSYQSLGVSHAVELVYDSGRLPNDRSFFFRYPELGGEGQNLVTGTDDVVTKLEVEINVRGESGHVRDGFKKVIASAVQGGGLNAVMPGFGRPFGQSVTADLSSLPTGQYTATIESGVYTYVNGVRQTGAPFRREWSFVHVNSRRSEFGAGWGIAGLQKLVIHKAGLVILVDGGGSQRLYQPATGNTYTSPAGDFSRLERLADGSFRRTLTDQTVYSFSSVGLLQAVKDRNGNETRFAYDANKRISTITDPVGLITKFEYTDEGVSIKDPAERITRLVHDSQGNLTQITDADGTRRQFAYDGFGRMAGEINKRGNTEHTEYLGGRVSKSTRRDGSVVEVVSAQSGSLTGPAVAKFVDGNGNATRYVLDKYGQVLSTSDTIGLGSQQTRNADMQVTRSVDPRGFQTRYAYDDRGNVTTIDETNSASQFPGEMFFLSNDVSDAKIADINGDGVSDVIAADRSGGRVLILHGNGVGGLLPARYFPVGVQPGELELGDFNADGTLDIVVAHNQSGGNIFVILSDGLGGFQSKRVNISDVSFGGSSVAVTDVNADGRLDIVASTVGSPYGLGIAFLLGDGLGNFPQQSKLEFGGTDGRIAVADLNNDGRLDIAVNTSTNLRVLHGNTSGGFTAPTSLPLSWAVTVVLADLNNDGLTDVVSGRDINKGTGLQVLMADGSGGFITKDYGVGQKLSLVYVVDFDEDGILDIIGCDALGSASISVFLGTASGLFQSQPSITLPGGRAFGFGHFNGDKSVDIVAVNYNYAAIGLADGNGGFQLPIQYPAVNAPEFVAVVDFNQDSRPDILEVGRAASILRGNDSGTFDQVTLSTSSANSAVVGDINRDGWQDIVLADLGANASPMRLILSDGRGGFRSEVILPGNISARSIALADVIGDQALDLVIVPNGQNQVEIRSGDGNGNFATAQNFAVGTSPASATAMDIDGDGDQDLIVTNYLSDDVSVLVNTGNGSFQSQTRLAAGDGPWFVASGDVNGDGHTDIVTSNLNSRDVSIILGDGLGNFQPQFRLSYKDQQGVGTAPLRLGDINDDGIDDIVVTVPVPAAGVIRIIYGNKNGSFEIGNSFFGGGPFDGKGLSALGDINQDNVIDLVSAFGNNSLAISFGNSNSGGNVSRTMEYDPQFSQLTLYTDERGRRTQVDIDSANGNTRAVTRIVGLADATSGETNDVTIQFTYTSRGLVDTVTDPLGRVADYDYDALGRLITVTQAVGSAVQAKRQYEYDSVGNPTVVVDENGGRTEFQYDVLNRVTRIMEADPDGDGPLGSPITTMEYDENGNVIRLTDAQSHVTEMKYDSMDRVNRIIDEQGNVTRYRYDKEGNLLETIDPLGQITVKRYDRRNRLVNTIDPDGGVTKFRYDVANNLTQLIDPVGNVTQFAYDFRNRMTTETDPLGKTIQYTYDSANNLIRKTDRLGRETEFTYDELNRLTAELWRNTDASLANEIAYTYDKASNLIAVEDFFSSLAMTYDERNRVNTVDNLRTPNAPRVVLDYDYDAIGNVASVTDHINGQGGATTAYTYDALHRTTRITQSSIGGSPVSDKRVDFTYNALGQYQKIARYADINAASPVVETNYTYDTLNRLTDLRHKSATGDVAFYTYTYDADSRINSITDIDGLTSYTYDDRDQLIGADHTDPVNPDESYEYDANGNRISSHLHDNGYITGPGNRLLSDGTFNYSYDDEGNTVRRTEIAGGSYREFTWDHRNRLVAVLDKNSANVETQRVEFSYDAFDRRIAKEVLTAVDTVVTHYVYDREDVLLDFVDPDGTGAEPVLFDQRYLHGPGIDQVLAQEDGVGDTPWLLTDYLGTVRDLTNSMGQIVNHIRYDSYGNILSQLNPAESNRYHYTARELDIETSLYFFRSRYYEPGTGRFVSEDWIGFSSGESNEYRYLGNNPIEAIDPFGFDGLVVTGIASSDRDLVLILAAVRTALDEPVSFKDLSSFVDAVIERAGDARIEQLNIIDHGNPDGFGVGNDWVTVDSLRRQGSELEKLSSLFDEGGFVHLQHCEVGQNLFLLQQLAKTFGVPVYAGTGLDSEALGLFRFNTGHINMCRPDGTCSRDVDLP